MTDTPLDYATAGVDTAAGDRAVELMKSAVAATHDSTVLGATGGFAGMVDASALLGMDKPLLATSTDGVGTKIAIAQAMDVHDTIGQDLVGMVVDDIVVIGARPVLMTDYIACGHVVPERIASIVTGIARACEATGTPLIGGETAEHPGVMEPDDYDIAGAATGVVDASKLLGPERVADGDVVIAMASSGLHSNGYSLVRSVVSRVGASLESHVAEFGRTLGEELLEPTRLYTRLCLDLVERFGVEGSHAYSHVTGGGLAANLSRVDHPRRVRLGAPRRRCHLGRHGGLPELGRRHGRRRLGLRGLRGPVRDQRGRGGRVGPGLRHVGRCRRHGGWVWVCV